MHAWRAPLSFCSRSVKKQRGTDDESHNECYDELICEAMSSYRPPAFAPVHLPTMTLASLSLFSPEAFNLIVRKLLDADGSDRIIPMESKKTVDTCHDAMESST